MIPVRAAELIPVFSYFFFLKAVVFRVKGSL